MLYKGKFTVMYCKAPENSYQVGRFLISYCQGAKQSLLRLKIWTLTLQDMNHYTYSLWSFQTFSTR